MSEAKLKSKCIKKLQSSGWIVVRNIHVSINGWPDTTMIKQGRTVHIEYKAEGKKRSQIQEYRHEQLQEQLAEVYTVDKYEQIEQFLD